MANPRNLKFVHPDIADVLSTPQQRAAFADASAAFEAGRLVRTLREQAGLTQQQLAELLDVSQPRVSAIESGAGRDGPSYALLKRIAIACGVSWNPSALLSKPVPAARAAAAAARRAVSAGA
jgi:DNA-binding XRE family transcriptional regulator